MSDGAPSSMRSRRPKRAPIKTSDDSILGISWKEERELRKAMYVSLRQRQRLHGHSSKTDAVKSPVVRSSKYNLVQLTYPFRWRHQRVATSRLSKSRSRTAKLRATVRITGNTIARQYNRLPPYSSASLKKPKPAKNSLRKPVSKIIVPVRRPKKPVSVARSVARQRHQRGSKSHDNTLEVRHVVTKQSESLSTLVDIKPESNCHHSPRTSTRQDVRCSCNPQPTRPNLPENYAPPLGIAKNSGSLTPRKRKLLTPVKQSTPPVTPSRPFIEENQSIIRHVSSSPTSFARPDRMLFPSETTCVTPRKRSVNRVPRGLSEDVDGKPVSVHDFVEFICYQGTSCLPRDLEWLNNRVVATQSNPPSDTSSSSLTPSLPSQESTYTENRCSSKRSPTDHSSTCTLPRSPSLCVAKKLATSGQSLVHRSAPRHPCGGGPRSSQQAVTLEWKKPFTSSTARMHAKRRAPIGPRTPSRRAHDS